MEVDGNKLLRELCALAIIFTFCFTLLSLSTYSHTDPSFNRQVSHDYSLENRGGVVGSYLAGFLVDFFGIGAWILIFVFFIIGLGLLIPVFRLGWYRWFGLALLFLAAVALSSFPWLQKYIAPLEISDGGYLGKLLFVWAERYLSNKGSLLFWIFLLLTGLQLTLGFTWTKTFGAVKHFLENIHQKLRRYYWGLTGFLGNIPGLFKDLVRKRAGNAEDLYPEKNTARDPVERGASSPRNNGQALHKAKTEKTKQSTIQRYDTPPLHILQDTPQSKSGEYAWDLEEVTEKLSSCLMQFGIQGEVVKARPGPVVTMLEFKPAPGIKVSKIANLNYDLALALKATAVRIEAPIPGKDTVGIEIPNKSRDVVFFQSAVQSGRFQKSKARLPMALGADIQGSPRVEDLAEMPHLLIAGATGAGKSVCLNTIIISFLFKASPLQMKLLLIDPKRIEMAPYADIPHLVHPVVTEMDMAKVALDWAVHEMEKRYEAMAAIGVRNIEDYNKKIIAENRLRENEAEKLPHKPYLVIIIDELADLMFTAGKEAEASIVRLAQLARAAGIHIILATQRPSVDVVTGLIKANFPARISFQVSSKHDSRTILDTVGAEYLLGKGDMLFKSSAGKLERIHGAYISDQDINAVVNFWKEKFPFQSELDLYQCK